MFIDSSRMEYKDGNCQVEPLKMQEEFAIPFGKGSDVGVYKLGSI